MSSDAYQLILPEERKSSLIFASPHSGCHYAPEFLSQTVLDRQAIRSSEDAFVDQLFAAAPRFGAPLLAAVAPRAYLDLNRSSEELDPALIAGITRSMNNPRISSGLGVVPRVVANGRNIYSGKISLREAERRIDGIWHPYHEKLTQLLEESCNMFGQAVLIDCHSMPHEAIEACNKDGDRPDVVLGDRFGAAAGAELMAVVESAFSRAGLRVARNSPFAGAFTAQHYGRPSRGQHVIQVEIDRSLYMDEQAIRPNRNFAEFRALITQVIAEITMHSKGDVQLAAE